MDVLTYREDRAYPNILLPIQDSVSEDGKQCKGWVAEEIRIAFNCLKPLYVEQKRIGPRQTEKK